MSRGPARSVTAILAVALALLVTVPPVAAAQQGTRDSSSVLVVHLPSAPVESASRLAEAARSFGDALSAQLPSVDLDVRIFRRWSDARAFLDTEPERVAFLLTDSSFLLDLPAGLALEPLFRFVRAGRGTYHRLLVVPAESAATGVLDLQGRRLGVVETTGTSSVAYLGRAVFEDEIDPASFFAAIVPETDELTLGASVVYGQIDAALVSEDNPLVAAELGRKLRTVYRSPALSLPVLSVRRSLLEEAGGASALGTALRDVATDTGGAAALRAWKLDGFEPVPDPDALRRLPAARRAALEVALPPTTAAPALATTSFPDAADLVFALTVELPKIPIADEPMTDEPVTDEAGSDDD